MKKKITQLRWLATMLMLVAAMVMPSTAWAQESTVTFTAKEGTAGFSDNESFDKLIDGKFTSDDFTKWCLTFPSDGAYIIFCASEPILVSGYSIVTGNDNAKEKARNPKSWALYGCNDESAGRNSDSWVLIDQKVEDTDLQDVNYQKYDFTLSNLSSEKYQYFKMEITATKGSSVLQMSELILTYTTCNHQWVKTGDVVDPTCTEGGYDVCKCSLCQLTKNEANDNGALGHQWVDGDVVPPTCTTDGYTPQTCSRCHAEQIINIVNATGHQWGNDDVCDVCQINNTVLNIPQGDGTLANPYKISTVGELYWFAGLVNGDASVCNDVVNQNTAACAKLMNDIVVNYDDDFSNHNWNSISRSNWFFWTPIGKQEFNIYTGTFDGQGHTISGLYFESCSNYYDQKSKEYDYQNRDYLSFGLFGFNSGTIKNVGVINSYFGWQYNYIGGVCGVNYGTIENCYNEGKVEGKGNDTGGICARNFGTITNCYNLGTVIGEYGTGGVCGVNFGTIKNCYYLSGTATGGINGADVEGSAESKTADQFKSGEVAWLLNSNTAEGTVGAPLMWYQNLSAESGDAYPVLTHNGSNTVYGGYNHGGNTGHFSNTVNDISEEYRHPHAYDPKAADEANGNHDKSYQGVFNWVDNANKTNATVTAKFTCEVCGKIVNQEAMTVEHDDEHPNTPAACTEVGYNYFKTSYAFAGATFTDSYIQTVPVLGHNMNVITFNEDEKIYSNQCQREGCGYIGYYATSDGMVKAIENPEGDGFTANDLTLQDARTYDNQAVFTATNFKYTRTFSNTNWTTWYVPFELALTDDICKKYAFSRINNVHQYDDDSDGNADRTVVESFIQNAGVTLKANYPYLVRAKNEGDLNMELKLTGVKPALAETNSIDCQSVDYKYVFTGTYVKKGESGTATTDPYSLWTDGAWHHFQTLEPMRHYLTIQSRNASSASPAPMRSIKLSIVGEEDTTGIVNIYNDERRASETYDLSGRRLPAGSQHGLVIQNGKIVFKK